MRRPGDHISERELSAMTSDLDQRHHDEALPAMKDAVERWMGSLGQPSPRSAGRATSRRNFLLGAAGAGAAGLLVAACGSTSKGSSSPTTVAPALTGDLAVAATAASLENLGVHAYQAALNAASTGKLGNVPPAVATFAQTALGQHQDHAKAWNAALTGAGHPAVTATDPALTPTVDQQLAKVGDVTQLAELALLVENIAAQTYQNAIPSLSASSSVAVAATIQPVEMQHAAILYYVLGRYPGIQGKQSDMFAMGAPLAFSPTALARPVSDYSGS